MSNHHQRTLKVTVPSGKVWEIRETNGDDDAILSTIGTAATGENVFIFLSNIIVGPGDVRASVEDVKNWKINDKYYLLFKQRIFNVGHDFKFKATDPNDQLNREEEYIENLAEIDGDLSDPQYVPKPNQVFKYSNGDGEYDEFSTSSGRKFRYKMLTGKLEIAANLQAQANNNRNTPLIIREIEEFISGQWLRLMFFKSLSSKEMGELRTRVEKNDPQFNPMVHFRNQFTQTPFSLPLLSFPTFYFPEETI